MSDIVETQEDRDDDVYELDKDHVNAICEAAVNGEAELLSALMEPLHAADVADLLEQISESERTDLIRLYGKNFDGEILSELDEGLREEIIEQLSPQVLADAVRDLESDDVVDILEDLPESSQETLLEALEDSDRVAAEQALNYPEYSAGRLMQREVVIGPDHWNVGEAIDFIRASEKLPDQFYHLTLVNPRLEPVGNVTLGRILSTKRDTPLKDVQEKTFRVFNVEEDEADVAYAFNQYHLISAPVVDKNDRLVGVVTIDDAMAVLDEEHEEDMLRMAGVGESSLSDNAMETAKQRLPWLAVNLVTAIVASLVIAVFEGSIEKLVALAVLMPIVASMGGNAGTQTLTVAVRSISTILAGTSLETHHRFLREAETLRLEFVQALNKVHAEKLDYKLDMNRNASEEAADKAVVGADNWAILAEFDFKPEAGSTRISNALIYFIQLLLWMGLTALLLQAAVRRLNP